MYRNIITLLAAGLFLLQLAYGQTADIVLYNGKIFTSDTTLLWVEALAIEGNKIKAIGSTASIKELIGKETKTIDLKGKTVVPGFNDAHEHLGWKPPIGVSFKPGVDFITGLSGVQALDSIARLVKTTPKGEWIEGEFGLLIRNDPSLRREALDKVAPHHPVILL
ncbi:MAG TPA: amidohydrolase family protein, partial [Anditalea sp.]|nr:amidohydrolase family protein [Anditalea sp.]